MVRFIYGEGNKRRDVSEKKGGRVVVRGLCVESWINNAECVGVSTIILLLYSSPSVECILYRFWEFVD